MYKIQTKKQIAAHRSKQYIDNPNLNKYIMNKGLRRKEKAVREGKNILFWKNKQVFIGWIWKS